MLGDANYVNCIISNISQTQKCFFSSVFGVSITQALHVQWTLSTTAIVFKMLSCFSERKNGGVSSLLLLFQATFFAREDFCTVPWGEDEILVIGGYDDIGRQTRQKISNNNRKIIPSYGKIVPNYGKVIPKLWQNCPKLWQSYPKVMAELSQIMAQNYPKL